ncbi:MAG: TonB-dependent receptor plug domain-containing protein [Verrucomicrobiaceae bacterium]|nr:TonB-dependent receptor plug domain-containing protein [Verrucomicrobiaceae bacterium]
MMALPGLVCGPVVHAQNAPPPSPPAAPAQPAQPTAPGAVVPFVPPPPPKEEPVTTLKPVEIIEMPEKPAAEPEMPKKAPKPAPAKKAPQRPEIAPEVVLPEIMPQAVPDVPPEAMTISSSADGENLGEVVIVADRNRSARTASVSDLAIQPVQKIAGKELQRRAQGTIGETLAGTPGVTSNYFSPGASRPVIRGFDGVRVRMMQDGLSTMDLSDTSPDHGVAIEPLLAEEIEVHRGPASLLFGNGAIGGAVNVKSRHYARELPAHSISGAVDSRYETNAEGWAESGWLALRGGPFVLQFTGSLRESEDIRIPQTARTPEYDLNANPRVRNPATGAITPVPNPSGRLPNSFHQAESYSIGLSFLPEDSPLWSAFSFSSNEARYGLPYIFNGDINAFFGNSIIDFTQERYDWELGYDFEDSFVKSIQAHVANSQFGQEEFVQGTGKDQGRFITDNALTKDVTEGRLNLYHGGLGDRLDGVIGVHAFRERFTSSQLTRIQPELRQRIAAETRGFAVYGLEKLTLGDFHFQLGGRWGEQTLLYRNLGVNRPATGISESAYSYSAAVTWEKKDFLSMERFALGLVWSRTQRIPTATERYAFWNSAALGRFLIGGDVDGQELKLEQATGIDATLDAEWERFAVHLSGFHYDFQNYIFLQELARGPVLQRSVNYIERGATFFGWEAEVESHLIKHEHQRLTLKLMGDYVRGWNDGDREYLPRMPPMHLGGRLEGEYGPFSGGIELRYAFDQNRFRGGFRSEGYTDPYTLLNADFTCQLFKNERYDVSLTFQATNLLDADARQATSFRKDVAPMPGRGFSVGMQVRF